MQDGGRGKKGEFCLFKAKSPPKCRRGYKRRIIP